MSAPVTCSDLFSDVAACASRYVHGVTERKVVPSREAVAALERIGGPLPDGPASPEAVLELATIGGRFFGLIVGGATPASMAASWMVSA